MAAVVGGAGDPGVQLMADDADFSGVADLIPEGCLPLHAIRIVEYALPNGTSDFHFKVDGDVNLSTTIGTLAIVQDAYVTEIRETLH